MCFPLGGDVPLNRACVGVAGVVEAYRVCLPQVKLYGPTNFSPVINHVACFAKQAIQQTTASVSTLQLAAKVSTVKTHFYFPIIVLKSRSSLATIEVAKCEIVPLAG